MSEQKDRDFERYLEGGDPVSRTYRELGGELPSAEVDRAVIANARAALVEKRTRFARWHTYAAIAATVVLSVAVVLRVGVETDREIFGIESQNAAIQNEEGEMAPARAAPEARSPGVVELDRYHAEPSVEGERRAPDAARTDERVSPPASRPELRKERAPGVGGGTRAKALNRSPDRVDKLSSPQPAPVAAPAAPEPTLERSLYRSRATGASAVSQADDAHATLADSDPEGWLKAIEELRKAGQDEQADLELKRFRARYPGYLESREVQPTK